MPSLKKQTKGLIMEYESILEYYYLQLLDQCQSCMDFQSQPCAITYTTISGREEVIFPDVWAIFRDGRQFLYEIKNESKYQKLLQDKNWELKIKAIQDYCKVMGWTYQVITERKIFSTRLDNIKDLLTSAKHYSLFSINKKIGSFSKKLKQFLNESPKKLRELASLLDSATPLKFEEIVSLLKYQIYYGLLSIDWDKPLEETLISLNDVLPIPVCDLPDNPLNDKDGIYSIILPEDDDEKFKLNDMELEEWHDKLNLIKPLIELYGKDGVRSNVLKYCEENNLPFERTYRFYRIWKKEGEEGLLPKRKGKHKKSHIDQRVEVILQDYIQRWNNDEWCQIKAVYTKEFKVECINKDLKPCSYETFRRRVQALPAVEKRGKFKPSKQKYIKRGLKDSYKEGRHPACVIQMDHTLLDIWVMDSFTKQPLGRPWITIGIDVFSRSIWCVFISLAAPSQESVTQAILNGLIDKRQTKEWLYLEKWIVNEGYQAGQYALPCSGFPARIQVDNSKEFNAKSVKDFCMSLNITLEFRPVRTPEYGGSIESLWDTINDDIRGAKLGGRVYPLPKSREAISNPKIKIPPGYNAKKTASLTFNQFKDWLFSFITIKYSTTLRADQEQSPNELWKDGICGDRHQPMGGALKIVSPSEFQMLDFQSKISRSAQLSEKGIRYKNILYTSDWLIEARKRGVLKDKQFYEFKISNWDVRTIMMKDPETNRIEILEARKYVKDDRINKLLLRSMGKIGNYREFPLSRNAIEYFRKSLGETQYDSDEADVIMANMMKELAKTSKANIKERKLFENLSKTKEGREEISAVSLLAQLKDKDASITEITDLIKERIKRESEEIEFEPELEDDGSDGYATEWKDVKGDMMFWNSNTKNDKDEEIE